MKAVVYKSTGSWYVVKNEEGEVFNARIKGIFKMDGLTSTNPIAVGDVVDIESENENEKTVTITNIYDRHNYIARTSPHHRMHHHIVASNLDQSLLFATLRDPKTSNGFLDRFLVSCEAYHIPAIIVFNKADIYRQKEMVKYEEWKRTYETCGYTVVLASIVENKGVDEVKEMLHNKKTLLSGHSGVGKSTFINAIFPKLNLRTSDVSGWSGKGMHTTTFAEMYDLPNNGRIIDTPGVKEFGLVDISKQELSHYFPEMRSRINECQFNNCMHINEPDCAVKQALQDEIISEDRYVSYLSILDSIKENNY
jgi:ribosome biogenesis GTPase